MLDYGGAVHAADAQVFVVIAFAELGPVRLCQLAHPAHAVPLRVVMQTKASTAVFSDNVHPFQPFGLLQFSQPPHSGVALVGDIRQDQGQVQFKLFSHAAVLIEPIDYSGSDGGL